MKQRELLKLAGGLAVAGGVSLVAWNSTTPNDSSTTGARGRGPGLDGSLSATSDQTDEGLVLAARVISMPEGRERDELLSGMLTAWVASDAASADRWVNSLPVGPLRNAARAVMAGLQEPNSGSDASASLDAPWGRSTDFADQRIPPSAATNQPPASALPTMPATELALRDQARALLDRDPKAALEWAQDVNTEDMRLQNELVYAAFTRLVEQDPTSAADWLTNIPSGQGRDEATRILVDGMMEREPAAAFSWARSIGDAAARRRSTERALQHWLAVDESAARAGVRGAMGDAATRGDSSTVRQLAETLQKAELIGSALRYKR